MKAPICPKCGDYMAVDPEREKTDNPLLKCSNTRCEWIVSKQLDPEYFRERTK